MKARMSAAIAVLAFAAMGHASAQPITPPPSVELPPDTPSSTLLPALIAHSRHVARLENGQLSGEGADFLRELGRNAHAMMIGEDHGNAGIADFSTALWRDLNAAGYQYGAIEVDPYIAAAARRDLRAETLDTWNAYLAANGSGAGAPFLTWAPEARFAAAIVQDSNARREPALWGLDQVFIGAGPSLLRQMSEGARSAEARALAAQLANESSGSALDGFARIDVARLEALRAALNGRRDAYWAEMADAMILSHRIYQPFVTGAGEANLANNEREQLMRRLFQTHYEAAERADGEAPRVIMKFGANHMYRGATPTWVQGLGGFVSEYMSAHGRSAASLYVMCGPGGAIASLQGPPTPCDGSLAENFPYLAGAIDPEQVTIFDLRVWRLRPRRWAHLPAEAQAMIGSFDALVFVPNGAASEFLPGLSLPMPPAQ